MATVIIGNSIVRDLQVEEVARITMPGKKLAQMRDELELPNCLKLVVSGIPDIIPFPGARRVSGTMVSAYEEELMQASNIPGVVLCPFYPPRALERGQWGVVHRLNSRMCELNARRGYGTPATVRGLFGRGTHGNFYFNDARLRDGVHPGPELAAELSAALASFVDQRRQRIADLRGVLDRRGQDREEGQRRQDRQDRQEGERRQDRQEGERRQDRQEGERRQDRQVGEHRQDRQEGERRQDRQEGVHRQGRNGRQEREEASRQRERRAREDAMAERDASEERVRRAYEEDMERIARIYLARLDEAGRDREREVNEERAQEEAHHHMEVRRGEARHRREQEREDGARRNRDIRRDVPVRREFA